MLAENEAVGPVMRRLFGLGALLLLTACQASPTLTPQPTPISAEAATTLAIERSASSVPVKVLSMRLTTIGAAMQGTGAPDKSAPAWAMVLSGSFYDETQCGPQTISPPQCGPHATTALVVIDARTGEMWSEMPAPSPS